MADEVIFDNDFIEQVMNNNSLYTLSNDRKKYEKFSRYNYFDLNSVNTTYKEYMFFSKPHLNTNGMDTLYPKFVGFLESAYPHVLDYLTKGGKGFIPLLSNATLSSSGLEVPDLTGMEIENMQNIFGASVTYRGQSLESGYNNEFTIEFQDTKFSDVYMLFAFWDKYCTLKNLGYIAPLKQYLPPNAALEDQISIYKIVTAEDYSTILYFGKYTGVLPKSITRSVYNTLEGGVVKIPITFNAFLYEDMDPDLIDEFNATSGVGGGSDDIMSSNYIGTGQVDREWCSGPYIGTGDVNGRPVYKLKWAKGGM